MDIKSVVVNSVQVTEKTGREHYKGKADVSINITFETRKWLFKKGKEDHTHTIKYEYSVKLDNELMTLIHFRPKNMCEAYFQKVFKFLNKGGTINEIRRKIAEQLGNLQSDDECCSKPDLERSMKSFTEAEIIKEYLERKNKYTIQDHGKKPAFVNFLDHDTDFHILWTPKITDKTQYFHKYACLNCGSCLFYDQEEIIKNLEDFIKQEVRKKERQKLANEICGYFPK